MRLLERDSLDTIGIALCGRYICRRGKGFLRYYHYGAAYLYYPLLEGYIRSTCFCRIRTVFVLDISFGDDL